jgi:hypothetical protein
MIILRRTHASLREFCDLDPEMLRFYDEIGTSSSWMTTKEERLNSAIT